MNKKKVTFVDYDNIRRVVIVPISGDCKKLNINAIISQLVCEKLKAKYIVRFEEI